MRFTEPGPNINPCYQPMTILGSRVHKGQSSTGRDPGDRGGPTGSTGEEVVQVEILGTEVSWPGSQGTEVVLEECPGDSGAGRAPGDGGGAGRAPLRQL